MARKKIEDTSVVIESGEVLPAVLNASQEITNQASEHSLKIMDSYGEGLPYDRSRVVHEARFYMAQSAEAMLEAGKRLIILKEHEPHGDFETILRDHIGLPERTAQRMMQSAFKYLSPKLQSKAPALALLGKAKLFELMTEDDDSLSELAEGGTIAGLTLDDIDRMSSRELRAALRDAKEDNIAKSEVIAAKSSKIDDLQTKMRKIKKVTGDEEMQQARKEVAAIESDIEALVRVQLRSAFNQLQELADRTGTTDHLDFVASQLDLLDRAVLQIRAELGIERTAEQLAGWEEERKDS